VRITHCFVQNPGNFCNFELIFKEFLVNICGNPAAVHSHCSPLTDEKRIATPAYSRPTKKQRCSFNFVVDSTPSGEDL